MTGQPTTHGGEAAWSDGSVPDVVTRFRLPGTGWRAGLDRRRCCSSPRCSASSSRRSSTTTSRPAPRPALTAVVRAGRLAAQRRAAAGPPAGPARPSRGGRASAGIKPVRLKPIDVGVASMNMFRQLSSAQAAQDARAADRPGERRRRRVAGGLPVRGGAARAARLGHPDVPGRRRGPPSSRCRGAATSSAWSAPASARLVDGRERRRGPLPVREPAGRRRHARAPGDRAAADRASTPTCRRRSRTSTSPDRWTATINAFRARAQLDRLAATWRHAPGRWVVGTGDFNFDAGADARQRSDGRPAPVARRRVAVSSYQRLGRDMCADVPRARPADRLRLGGPGRRSPTGRIAVHPALGAWPGCNSDHNALVARLRLS